MEQNDRSDSSKEATEKLLSACADGDAASAFSALRVGAEVNARSRGLTPLIVAAQRGHLDVVRALLDAHADFNARSLDNQMAAVHYAAADGHNAVVEELLRRGCDPRMKSAYDYEPIHFAASQNRLRVCEELLSKGADLTATTSSGATVLSLATNNKLIGVVRWCLSQPSGASLVNLPDRAGVTPLHKAAQLGDLSIVKLLAEIGHAELSPVDSTGSTPFDEADRNNMSDAAIYLWLHGAHGRLVKRNDASVGPARWVRPRVITPPEARFHASVCARGSRMVAYGGVGLPKGTINHDPENPLAGNVKAVLHNDLHELDLDDWSLEPVLPTSEAQWRSQRNFRWSFSQRGPRVRVDEDALTARAAYPLDSQDCVPSLVKASEPFREQVGFGYFEVEILNPGPLRMISVGLTDDTYPLTEQPGWSVDSYALHGDDGAVYHNSGRGSPFCQIFEAGDVVGCGINWRSGEIFFTRNGAFLGIAFRGPQRGEYWATVGVENPGAEFRVNFGAAAFHFGFQIPTFRWKSLPQLGDAALAPPAMRYSHLVSLRGKPLRLLLLPEFRFALRGFVWLYDMNEHRWSRQETTGDPCPILPIAQVAQLSRSIFVFNSGQTPQEQLPDTATSAISSLYRLDTTSWQWHKLLPPTDASNSALMDLSGTLASTAFQNAMMVAESKNLLFFTAEQLLVVDASTLEVVRTSPVLGFRPKASFFTAVHVATDSVVTFGGWDDQHARSDTFVLDVKTPQWYKPQISASSVLPRPRNHHSSVVVSLSKFDWTLDQEQWLPADALSSQTSEGAVQVAVHLFGWNGRNCIDDLDIFVPRPPNTGGLPADDLDWGLGKKSVCDLLLSFPDEPSAEPLLASRVIVSARSSKFRQLLLTPPTTTASVDSCVLESSSSAPATVSVVLTSPTAASSAGGNTNSPSTSRGVKARVEIRGEISRIFSALLQFLYSDAMDFLAIGDRGIQFLQLVREWAPEHERRAAELLTLTMVRAPSHLSRDLSWAFLNATFSDVVLIVDGKSVVAHKSILCSRSSYFRGLCLSGLRESRERTIPLPDTSYDPFLVVLEYIYTKRINYDKLQDVVVDAFVLACRFALYRLKSELEGVISSNLSVDNVCSLLLLADQHHATSLCRTCADFINANRESVQRSEEFLAMKKQVQSLVDVY